jgi:glutamine phosphoribosylpyrophosphate amidotransferase
MCGIGGIIPSEGVLSPVEALGVATLWEGLEDRGRHAAGAAIRKPDENATIIAKGAGPATRFTGVGIAGRAFVGRTDFILLHTRFTTQGSVDNNANNHPVISNEIVLTHNGVLWNDDLPFSHFDATRVAQVDTEALNAGLRHGGVEWVAQNLEGSFSVAWVNENNPNKVNLLTNGRNPLVIGRLTTGAVVWASNLYHLQDAFGSMLDTHFNAQPFKHYWVSIADGVIRSRFVSEERAAPEVLGRYSHKASYGSAKPRSTSTTCKPKKSRQKKPKTQKQTSLDDFGGWAGWYYDEDAEDGRGAWKKMKRRNL